MRPTVRNFKDDREDDLVEDLKMNGEAVERAEPHI